MQVGIYTSTETSPEQRIGALAKRPLFQALPERNIRLESRAFFVYIYVQCLLYRSFRKYCGERLKKCLIQFKRIDSYLQHLSNYLYNIYTNRVPHGHVNIPLASQYNCHKERRENTLPKLTLLNNIYETYCSSL